MLRKVFILVVMTTLGMLVACQSQVPLRIASNDVSNFTEDKMALCIKEAAKKRNWATRDIEPGLIEAVYTKGGAVAAVNIEYDKKNYKITMNYQTTLDEPDGRVASKFNRWVRNLDREIGLEINRAENGSGK